MDVKHEDAVCRLFPCTFIGQASTWFFSLAIGSIASWQKFETAFLNQFGDDRIPGVLFLKLSRIRFNKKDNVKYFNKKFINLLKRILDKPVESIQVEFYTVCLPPPIAMFVKAREKITLEENFVEAIKVERDLAYISSHQGNIINIFIIGYCSQCDNVEWETFTRRIWKYQVESLIQQFKGRNPEDGW